MYVFVHLFTYIYNIFIDLYHAFLTACVGGREGWAETRAGEDRQANHRELWPSMSMSMISIHTCVIHKRFHSCFIIRIHVTHIHVTCIHVIYVFYNDGDVYLDRLHHEGYKNNPIYTLIHIHVTRFLEIVRLKRLVTCSVSWFVLLYLIIFYVFCFIFVSGLSPLICDCFL